MKRYSATVSHGEVEHEEDDAGMWVFHDDAEQAIAEAVAAGKGRTMNQETLPAQGPVDVNVRDLNSWSHKELMALPVRKWDDEKEYDSLLLVSTRKKHDSGWAVIAIIGVRNYQPEEIACACCDDIEWKMPPMTTFGSGRWTIGQFRTDCAFRSGALHAWQRGARFKVGAALSSTTVEMIPNVKVTGAAPEKG